jgi:hypothetical protein
LKDKERVGHQHCGKGAHSSGSRERNCYWKKALALCAIVEYALSAPDLPENNRTQ